jgi:hypothetical protein
MNLSVGRSSGASSFRGYGSRGLGSTDSVSPEQLDQLIAQLRTIIALSQQSQAGHGFNDQCQSCATGVRAPGLSGNAPQFGAAAPSGTMPMRNIFAQSGGGGGPQSSGWLGMLNGLNGLPGINALRNTANNAFGSFQGLANRAVDLFRGFSQSREGNCVSVAWMKAAMARFGARADQVFSRADPDGAGGYNITMRDGKQVRVTRGELATARRMSSFKGSNAGLVEQANIIYAAMAKRAQLANNDGHAARSFVNACRSLNDGEAIHKGANWLGLSRHVRSVTMAQARRLPFAVGTSHRHAIFASNGSADHYGRRVGFNATDTIGGRLTQAFTLV